MIKKVKVDDLRPGMFIHDFNRHWGAGNIYISKMLVRDNKVIEIIKSWDIQEVYIDTERGMDVSEQQPHRVDHPSGPGNHPPTGKSSPGRPAPSPVPFAIEAQQAISLRKDAAKIIQDTVRQIDQGKPPNISQTYELADRMRSSIRRNRDALVLLSRIRKKDEYTLYHSISVSSLLLNFCNFKGIPEKQSLDLAVAGLFHDIGKTKIPSEILNKPTKLTAEEYQQMQKHVEISLDLLCHAKNLPFECFDIALHHHERVDGGGYPDGLLQDQIGYGAQLTAICDVFDAITSARCYKEAMGTVAGLQVIYQDSGSHFNKDLAHEFIRCMGVYPVGSCVRLEDGKVGIIAERTGDSLKPIVKVYRDARRRERFKPFLYDLSRTNIAISRYEDPATIGLKPSALLSALFAT